MPEFSIIIPVYNAAETLARCLDSLCAQTFDDYEIILVDDGSTDRSPEIYRGYCEKNSRIRCIRQENRGPSAARNCGLAHAEGIYLCFVDSDDYVSPDYLEKLAGKAEASGADIIFFGYYSVDGKGNIIKKRLPPVGLSGNALITDLSRRNMFGYTWIKCFSRKAVNGVLFPEDMTLFEDEVYTCSAAMNAAILTTIDEPLYYYTSPGKNALSRRLYPDYCLLSDRVFQAWKQLSDRDPSMEPFLQKKAGYYVERCKYYGFEHDVDIKSFFGSLAETSFFRERSGRNALDRHIQHRNWPAVKAAVLMYRAKNRIASAFGKT